MYIIYDFSGATCNFSLRINSWKLVTVKCHEAKQKAC